VLAVIQYLTNLPEWLTLVLSLCGFSAFGVVGLLATRRILDRYGVVRTQPAIAGWATCLAALTALLYAFVVANLWVSSNTSRANVNGEAAAIRLLARDIAPSERGWLREYAGSVVADEWPQLCGGEGSPKTAALLWRLENQAKPAEQGVRMDFYLQLAALENLRYVRLQAGGPSIPPEIWVALTLLSMLLLAITFFAHLEHLGFHLGLTLVLASALATLFWLTIQLDYPFCGGTVVTSGAILDALHSIGG
jgi:hypothetical protein